MENLKDIQELNHMLFEKEHEEYDKLLNCNWTLSKEGEEYYKGRISKDDECAFIAVEGKKVIGYLVGSLTEGEDYRNLPKVAELDNTFVLKEYRKLGVGTKLHQEFIKWCKSKKVEIIKVQATAQNDKAINFYRKNGFKDYTRVLEHKLE